MTAASRAAIAPAGGPVATSRKSTAKREAIIRAAIEVINAKSYALATMTEIAASLDLRDATLYYYFPSKQELVYACHVRSLERFEALLDEIGRAGGTGAARLRHFIRAMLDESDVNGPQLYFGDHSYLEAAQRERIDAWADRLRLRLQGFVEAGLDDRSIAPCEPELVTELILGSLIWLGKWVPSIPGLTVDRLMASFEATIFRGLDAPA